MSDELETQPVANQSTYDPQPSPNGPQTAHTPQPTNIPPVLNPNDDQVAHTTANNTDPPPPSYVQATSPPAVVDDAPPPVLNQLSYPTLTDLSPAPAPANNPAPPTSVPSDPLPLPPFTVKKVEFFGDSRTILLQNENGPCPLLALSNVLILRNVLTLPAKCVAEELVSFDELVQLIGGLALDSKSLDTDNLQSLIDLLPTLAKGLDVNPKFCEGVMGYEYTDKIVAFDAFGVELVHGWLIDPSDPNHDMFKNLSYNQLVELVISSDSSGKVEEIVKGDAARAFLDASSHQLTYHGLTSLHTHLPSNSLSVFFRNNHFSTIFQHDNKMFLLVTDQGYSSVSEVVWEVLSNIDGDTFYVNSSFQKPSIHDDYTRTSSIQSFLPDADLQAAISASLNLDSSNDSPPPAVSGTVVNLPGNSTSTPNASGMDAQMARNLQQHMNMDSQMRSDAATARMIQQQEEYEYQQQTVSARQQQQQQQQQRKKKTSDSSCSVM